MRTLNAWKKNLAQVVPQRKLWPVQKEEADWFFCCFNQQYGYFHFNRWQIRDWAQSLRWGSESAGTRWRKTLTVAGEKKKSILRCLWREIRDSKNRFENGGKPRTVIGRFSWIVTWSNNGICQVFMWSWVAKAHVNDTFWRNGLKKKNHATLRLELKQLADWSFKPFFKQKCPKIVSIVRIWILRKLSTTWWKGDLNVF